MIFSIHIGLRPDGVNTRAQMGAGRRFGNPTPLPMLIIAKNGGLAKCLKQRLGERSCGKSCKRRYKANPHRKQSTAPQRADGLEEQIGRNLTKLALEDLVMVGWVVEDLLDQSTC